MKRVNKGHPAMRVLLLLYFCIFSAMTRSGSGALTHSDRVLPSDSVWSKHKATVWFNAHKWLNGLKMTPHASIDKQKFALQYHTNKTWWDKAFAFLKENDLLNLKPGKYEIDGENVYATVTEAPTKALEATTWESHRKYNDVQCLIRGHEKIGIAPVPSATVTKEYDSTKDLMNYDAQGKFYIAKPGTFFIMMPQDAHRPSIKVEGYDVVKKIVVKVRTGL